MMRTTVLRSRKWKLACRGSHRAECFKQIFSLVRAEFTPLIPVCYVLVRLECKFIPCNNALLFSLCFTGTGSRNEHC